MNKRMLALVAGAALALTGVAHGQANPAATPKIAPGTPVQPSKTFDDMLSGFEKELMGAARAMPADKYSFAPTPATFAAGSKAEYKGVKTFAQELTHIAEANYYYGAPVGGLKTDVDMKKLDALTNKDEILAALQASFAFLHTAFANLTEKNAFESVHELSTRASLAGGVVAHGFDHYGQIVEYLRMNGIVPPASMK